MGHSFASCARFMFREITPDLWVVEQPFVMVGLELGARMTIVRRTGGDLWVYAPFHLEADEETALKRAGHVGEVVVPNAFHTTQVGQFARRFPDATVYALSEAQGRLGGVPHQILETLPPAWSDDFEALLFDGARGFREWVFLHRASRTLIVTDLGFHLPKPSTPLGRIVARADDVGRGFGPSRALRAAMLLGDRKRQKAQLETILSWDFERILPGHGFVIERDAKQKLREAFKAFLSA